MQSNACSLFGKRMELSRRSKSLLFGANCLAQEIKSALSNSCHRRGSHLQQPLPRAEDQKQDATAKHIVFL